MHTRDDRANSANCRTGLIQATSLAALLAASVLAAGAAQAQSFYARETLRTTESGPPAPVAAHWQAGPWSDYSSACSPASIRTRSVVCVAGTQAVADTRCAEPRPAATEQIATYTGCGYAAGGTPIYGAWSSNCSDSANRAASYQCVRSDGAVVDEFHCHSRGIALGWIERGASHSGCSYAWQAGSWSGSSSTCSAAATQTRFVGCLRSDGATAADGQCVAASRPAATQTAADHTGCRYARGEVTAYGPWSSGCAADAVRVQDHGCARSDGTTVPNAECTSRGISLRTTSAPAGIYYDCTYSATFGEWSACSGGTQTAPVATCTRSDGASVPTSMCQPKTQACSSTSVCGPSFTGGINHNARWVTSASVRYQVTTDDGPQNNIKACNQFASYIRTTERGWCTWIGSSGADQGSVFYSIGGDPINTYHEDGLFRAECR